jgi:hypothetical protein
MDEFDTEAPILAERARLANGAPPATDAEGMLLCYLVTCSGDAAAVIERARTVLMALDELCLREPFPSDDEWRGILPSWLLSEFAPEMSPEEAAAHLAWLDSLSYDEKLEYARQNPQWDFSSWISRFEPDERFCYWWDARDLGDRQFMLRVEAFEYPFPFGPLDGLLRMCGAEKIDYEVSAAT